MKTMDKHPDRAPKSVRMKLEIKKSANCSTAALEKDCEKWSEEICEHIGGRLAAAKMLLETRLNQCEQKSVHCVRTLTEILEELSDIIGDCQRLSLRMYPLILDRLGLDAAIRNAVGEFQKQYPHIHVDFQTISLTGSLGSDIDKAIYRIVQQALDNVGRHSCAEWVKVEISEVLDRIVLKVEDNGCGFDLKGTFDRKPPRKGYGLQVMNERLEMYEGSLEVASAPDKGTRLVASLPRSLPGAAL